jgi:RNA polymerase sigma-70 factor, ECF subfamily
MIAEFHRVGRKNLGFQESKLSLLGPLNRGIKEELRNLTQWLGFTGTMFAASVALSPSSRLMPDPSWSPTESSFSTPLPMADGSSDAESVALMMQVKMGNERALERLIEIHQGAVIGTVTRMLGNVDDAHDVAQQLFIRVWKSAPRYEPTAKFTTWMYTIMRNLVFNELRKRVRRKEVSIDEPVFDDQPRQFVHPTSPGADVISQQEELERALDAAIAALPEKQRLAVVMRRYQDTPYEDLCEVLGMSLPAVKSLLFRARTELRRHLSAYLGEEQE